MKKIRTHQIAALLGLFALAACDESGTQALVDDLTPAESLELAVLEDPGSFDVALELNSDANDVAASLGLAGVGEGRGLNVQAAVRFAAAAEALRGGDRRRALEEARHARRLLARAIVATSGADGVIALIERIEELALITAEDDDVFDDPEALRARLEALAAEARELLASGDLVAAAERALLGEQIARHHRGRRHHPGDILPDRARLAVSLAGTAVALAERLVAADSTPVRQLGASNVRDHQNRWLAHARRMLEKAEHALAAGHFARAVHFAEHAHWSALKAVILPGGITEEELRAMVALAHHLYDEAKIALGDAPTELEQRLFARAGRLIELGERMLAEGNKRGVAPVWRGAVISRWLMD